MTRKSSRCSRVRLCSVLLVLALPLPVAGQQAAAQHDSIAKSWWLSSGLGLTALDVDQDPPGSMLLVAVERRFLPRLWLGLEAGSGFIKTGTDCVIGGVSSPCRKTSWWPMLSLEPRVQVKQLKSLGELYVVGQAGWQGSGLDAFAGIGFGLSFPTVHAFGVAVEVRHLRSFGHSGSGALYSFRMSQPLGSREAAHDDR